MDVGLIGNCGVAALVDRRGAINWFCLPRLDGDPVFHALLGHGPGAPEDGAFSIELDGFAPVHERGDTAVSDQSDVQ
ncbi:MAG: glycoside hydrolase family 15 protein, partial [Pseudomonadota bacterium]